MNPHEDGYFFPPYFPNKNKTEDIKMQICHVTINVNAEFFWKWKYGHKFEE